MSEPIKLPNLPRPPIHLSGWTNELCEWAKDYARLAVEQNTEALRADAERYRWLTDDHADREVRATCRAIIEGMGIRSYAHTSAAIDAARAAPKETK